MDNRSKRKREKGKLVQDFSSFAVQYREQALHKISPQLALATFQYLTSSIESFKTELISETVLKRLMQHALVVRFIRVKNKDLGKNDPLTLIYQQVHSHLSYKSHLVLRYWLAITAYELLSRWDIGNRNDR